MADPTFFFVLMFGGSLVGIVTALVRRHDWLRSLLDIAAGAAGGFFGTPLWITFVQHVSPRIAEPLPQASPGFASLLSTLYYASPILGGFLGVGAIAVIYRVVVGRRSGEPWLARLGDFVKIVGIVYLAVALCLTLALLAYAAQQSRWDVVSSFAFLVDFAYGAALILAGWAVRRFAVRLA